MNWYQIENEAAVASPALLVYPERIAENLQRMLAQVGGDPRRLRPHVKTHKLGPVIELQVARGIVQFKTATIAEAEMVARAGGRDVLLAYPLIGPNVARFLAMQRAFPGTRFSSVADDPNALDAIAAEARAAGATVELFMDLDVGMHRTGLAPGPDAVALYRRLASTPGVCAGGLHFYDGQLHQPDAAERRAAWGQAMAPVWALRDSLVREGLAVPRMIGGGTPTFPFCASVPGVECTPGTTVLWDFGQPRNNPELDYLPAAALLARVVSRPAPNRLCVDLGHKAVASEMVPPRVRFFGLEDAVPVTHSEEHLVLETPLAAHFPPGTVLYGLPRHICPTVALHAEVGVVRNGRVDTFWPVTARARRITF